MDVKKALAQLQRGEIAPIYLLLGQEAYLANLFKEKLVAQVLTEDERELNYASFDLEETPLSLALEEAASAPFFGDYRMVVLENPYFLTAEKKNGGPEHVLPEFLAYLENPAPTSVVLIVAPYEKLDERKKVTKQLKKSATVIEVKPVDEAGLKAFINDQLTATNFSMEAAAVERLVQLTDFDLTKVASELNKLSLFKSQQKEITEADVEGLVPKTLEHNLFQMSTYVIAKKTAEALNLYQDLRLQGEEPIKINAILLSHFRLLLQVKILMTQGLPKKEMADYLKIHPFRIQLAMKQAASYAFEDLSYLFNELVENDYKMKTGQMDKELLFQLFLLRTTQKN